MDTIIGQPTAVRTLQAGVDSGRAPHGYIFHGPQGVGKFTTALAYARLLLCLDRQTDLHGQTLACGVCEACTKLGMISSDLLATTDDETEAESHAPSPDGADDEDAAPEPPPFALMYPDFHVVAKELARYHPDRAISDRKLMNIPLEVVRQFFIEPIHLRSWRGRGKVMVIDEAELLDDRSQNAILKTLEEPPPDTYVILVTTSEERLLPTIRSRCQRIAFLPLADAELERWLGERHPELSDEQRRLLLTFADGSMGRLEHVIRFELTGWPGTIDAALSAISRGGAAPDLGETMAQLVDQHAKAWVDAGGKVAGGAKRGQVRSQPKENRSKEAANRMAAGLMWSLVTQFARQKLAWLAQHEKAPTEPAELEPHLEPWLAVIDAVVEAEQQVRSNVSLAFVCEAFAARTHQAFGAPRSSRR